MTARRSTRSLWSAGGDRSRAAMLAVAETTIKGVSTREVEAVLRGILIRGQPRGQTAG